MEQTPHNEPKTATVPPAGVADDAKVDSRTTEPFGAEEPTKAKVAPTPVMNVDNEKRFSDKVPMNSTSLALAWEDLTISAPDSKGKPTLIHPTSGILRPGVHALIGPTGAGKSVFLNALAGQSATNLRVGGRVVINGKQIHGESAKTNLSLVTQDDTLDGNLTIGECLDFAAVMQLGHMSQQQRNELVDDLLTEIGIDHVKDTVIGTALRRGVSGGQRKRCAVAVGLLRQPRVLILDEPTCGLDSTCALNVLRTLRALADKGAIIVLAIHQPQQAIFELFDTLMCIRGGRILYQDAASNCIPFFEELGIPYDGVTASADHIIEAISPATGQTVEEKELECPLMKITTKPIVDMTENASVPVDTNVTKQTWLAQCFFLSKRFFIAESRKHGTHIFNLICTLGCALLVSAAYYNVPYTQKGQKLRLSVLFFCCINQSLFGAMKVILAFPDQRNLMLAERRAGFYSVSPFVVAITIVDVVYTLIWPFLFALPVVFLTNLGQTAAKFFGFAFMLLLDKLCATSLAFMVVSLARTTSASLVILPMGIECSRLFSGYYLTPKAVPEYFVWLDPLSYVKYAFMGATLNELPGTTFACAMVTNATTGAVTENCDPAIPTTGEALMAKNGYDYITYGGCVGALFAYLIFTRVVTYLALRFFKSVG